MLNSDRFCQSCGAPINEGAGAAQNAPAIAAPAIKFPLWLMTTAGGLAGATIAQAIRLILLEIFPGAPWQWAMSLGSYPSYFNLYWYNLVIWGLFGALTCLGVALAVDYSLTGRINTAFIGLPLGLGAGVVGWIFFSFLNSGWLSNNAGSFRYYDWIMPATFVIVGLLIGIGVGIVGKRVGVSCLGGLAGGVVAGLWFHFIAVPHISSFFVALTAIPAVAIGAGIGVLLQLNQKNLDIRSESPSRQD